MSITARIFCAFFIATILTIAIILYSTRGDFKPRFREVVEEPLVDISRVMGSLVAERYTTTNSISGFCGELNSIITNLENHRFKAQIYSSLKNSVNLRFILTDEKGIVLCHSFMPTETGKDYSKWIDIARTLRGEYGARTTKDNPVDGESSVIYVASPIIVEGKTAGVISVGKPVRNVNLLVYQVEQILFQKGLVACLIVLVLCLLLSFGLTKPIRELTRYAENIRDKKIVPLPKLKPPELKHLGETLVEMRKALDGKEYIERYVQNLTHELKSPIAAILGATEIIEGEIPQTERNRFHQNIKREGKRLENLVQKMLALAALESKESLDNVTDFDLIILLKNLIQLAHERSGKQLTFFTTLDCCKISGEQTLLYQAINNLIENAIDFSLESEPIKISLEQEAEFYKLTVENSGPTIPDYALSKIYDRFYSLPRPHTNQKSTGLGLAFVKEIIDLHQGKVLIDNKEDGSGVRAEIYLTRQEFFNLGN
jgi:two-component system sensor histidine kinase CreC